MGDGTVYDWIILVRISPVVDQRTASRLIKDDDSKWVASEASNVFMEPFDRGSMITYPSILFNAWRPRRSEDAQLVVDGYDHYILIVCKVLAVVEWTVWTGYSEAAAVKEGKDGLLGLTGVCFRCRLGPDVQCETVSVLSVPEAVGELINDREPIVSEVRDFCLWCNVRWTITVVTSAMHSLAHQVVTYAS